jgi:chemotaxis protein histidine kinase CheA
MSSLATLARSSLKQFTTILAEVRKEHGDELSAEELETLMWDKIVAGAPEGKTSKIPSTLLKKMKIQLPYMPEIINYIGCGALKPCGGLYVPCGGKSVEGIQYCGTCMKSGAKFGTLMDRGAPGTYTDPNDKREISYGTWLAKNEISIEDVHEMLHEQGFTFRIPEEYLTVNAKRAAPAKRRPGRPGAVKKTIVNDDGSESPQGSSLDGFEHKVVLKKGDESDVSALSDDDVPGLIAANIAERKAAETVEQAVIGKDKKLSKEEKELAKAAKETAKKLKEDEKTRDKAAKELAKSEKELAAAQKELAGEPKKEKKEPKEKKAPKEEKKEKEPKEKKAPKEEKEKKEKKAPSPKPAPSKRKDSPKAVLEKEESEDEEDEEIVIDGEEYVLRGNMVFDEEGTHVGTKVDGKIEWDEAFAGMRHMNR